MSGYTQGIHAQQSLKQKQVVSQKLIQSIGMMSLPLADLRDVIYEEVEKNPALEITQEPGVLTASIPVDNRVPDEKFLESSLFSNSSDPGYSKTFSTGDSESKQRFLEGAVAQEETLNDRLFGQIHLMNLPPEVLNLAERIIWNLNEDGFHKESPELLEPSAVPEPLNKALEAVRLLDPQGCACSDWKESILVQAGILGDAPDGFERFVCEGLPLLEKKKEEEVFGLLKISPDAWASMLNYIRQFNPFPGRQYSREKPQYIIPELIVRRMDDEILLIVNDEVLPVLQVNPDFEKMKDDEEDGKTRNFIAQCTRDADFFLSSLVRREQTLSKVGRAIINFQKGFFMAGPRHMKPLILKDVADAIGVHETTVSRITSNKYIQTDWGVFDLKYFFTNSVSASSGTDLSRVAVKEVIKSILTDKESEGRISDQKISDLLARRGIKLARRTVAKYRKELDLPSSYQR